MNHTFTLLVALLLASQAVLSAAANAPQTDYDMKKHPGESDRPDWDEKPVHKVIISKPFHIGATEVTLEQYRQFDPEYRKGKGLPTEAEWEYACRAGTKTVLNTGDKLPDGYLPWYTRFSHPGSFPWSFYFLDNKPSPEYLPVDAQAPSLQVAQRSPNAWGLYDMHGNLCEWCNDWYGPYEAGEQTDPRGRSDGDFRVFRDGPHSMLSRLVRSANRGAWIPESSGAMFGFRSPAITECSNGDLLATWYSTVLEGGAELCNAASRLRFGQSEWEEASPIWDGFDINDRAPKLWWDGEITIYHIARGYSENIVRTSTDNGASWSRAKPIYPQSEMGAEMIRTRQGVLMITEDAFVSLLKSDDNGKTWTSVGSRRRNDDIRPGGQWGRHAGIHAPVIELADARLMTIGRPHPSEQAEAFGGKALLSFSGDQGASWTYAASEFPAVTSVQRSVMIRLREGPILYCSYTDQWSEFYKGNRKGMVFKSKDGEFTGFGLFAAVSYDEGKTWLDRRLIIHGGPAREVNAIDRAMFTLSETMAEPQGYLAVTQSRDGRIQLLTSKNHYVFNLAWVKQRPPAPLTALPATGEAIRTAK